MRKPDRQFPVSKGLVDDRTPKHLFDPQLIPAHFDQLIANRGVEFEHMKATPCPNLTSIKAQDHDPSCSICDNGFLYYGHKKVMGVFTNQSLNKMLEKTGVWDVATAIITLSTTYEDGTQADFNYFDKLVLKDFNFRYWELAEYNYTTNINRLKYPVITVDTIQSADKEFIKDTDYTVENGFIKWLDNGTKPTFDPVNERGQVITVAYTTYPTWHVTQVLHELRISQVFDKGTGSKIATRFPQQVMVRRDYLHKHDIEKQEEQIEMGNIPPSNYNPGEYL